MMISLICPEPGQTEAISVAGRPVYAAPECMEYAKEIFQDAGTLMEDPLLREVHDAGLLWRLGLRQAEESAKDVRARAGNAAEAVLKLIDEDKQIRLIAACAFRGMENRWDYDWQERYSYVLSRSEWVYYISDTPGRKAFFARNHWMVDHASRLIAVYSGAPGGTKETIDYARKNKRSIVLLES